MILLLINKLDDQLNNTVNSAPTTNNMVYLLIGIFFLFSIMTIFTRRNIVAMDQKQAPQSVGPMSRRNSDDDDSTIR
jgi:NADH:ubiquinone oxidoreductase subunit H